MNPKPVIVISATRFFQGGTLVIVSECLKFLSAQYSSTHIIRALVHKKALYDQIPGIEWVEFPDSRKSVFNRLYDEYIRFSQLSKMWEPILWLSLQDSTPRVKATVRAVYFHNPLLIKPKNLRLWRFQFRLEVLRLLYKYIYTKGIRRNDFVIAQQESIANYLWRSYHLNKEKIRVFPPTAYLMKSVKNHEVGIESRTLHSNSRDEQPYTFIYPATAFYYKNHNLLLNACRLLSKQGLKFQVWLTVDGSENKYIKKLVAAAQKELPQIQFLGFINREDLFGYYAQADCMVFPSLLESWGLPLTEFAAYGKPVLCADLAYGRSTMSAINYPSVAYFDPADAQALATKMADAIQGKLVFNSEQDLTETTFLQMTSWAGCFKELLQESHFQSS